MVVGFILLTLSLKSIILSFEIVYILLVGRIFPPHELNVVGCFFQDLGSTGLKPGTILRHSFTQLVFVMKLSNSFLLSLLAGMEQNLLVR